MGTRPEAVKLAPVVAALRGANDFRCTVVATGQHKEMFRQVAETFGFAVDADLDVMRPNQTLAGLTARLHGRHRRLAGVGPARHGAGTGRHDHRAGGLAGVLLPAHPHRSRRGRTAHRQHLVALPGGGEPPAGHPARDAALRAHRDGSRGAPPRGRPGRRDLGDGEHRHRRAAHRGGPAGQRRGAARRIDEELCLNVGDDWAQVPDGAHHRAPPREFRGGHRADLPGDRHPGRAVSRPSFRLPGSPQSQRAGARQPAARSACRTSGSSHRRATAISSRSWRIAGWC